MKIKYLLLISGYGLTAALGIMLLESFEAGKSDFTEDFKKIAKLFSLNSKIHAEVEYTLYSDFYGNKILESSHGEFSIEKKHYYSKYFNEEKLVTPRFTIHVDKRKKYIFLTEYLQNNNPEEKKVSKKDFDAVLPLLDSAAATFDTIEYLGIKNNIKSYKLVHHASRFQSVVLSYDSKTYILKKMIVYPKVGTMTGYPGKVMPRAEINYTRIDLSPKLSKQQFSIGKFVQKVHEGYKPSAGYPHYKLFYKKIEK